MTTKDLEQTHDNTNTTTNKTTNTNTNTNTKNSSISIDLNTPPSYDDQYMEGEGEGEGRDDKMTHTVTPNRVFSCNYCMRKFFSSQALGGHQNAHKRERIIAKKAMRIGFLTSSSLPLHGFYYSTTSSSPSRPSIYIQAHHGSMATILPRHHGGPPKFQGQNGYYGNNSIIGSVLPYWPGSFRHHVDEAHSSTNNTGVSCSNIKGNNDVINDVIRDNDNCYGHNYVTNTNNPYHLDMPDSSPPDLTLKL